MTAARAEAAARQAPGGADPLACPSADARGPRSHGRRDSGAAAPPQVSTVRDRAGLLRVEEGWSWAGVPVLLLGSSSLEGTRGGTTRQGNEFSDFRKSHGIQPRQAKSGDKKLVSQTKGAGASCVKWFFFLNSQFMSSPLCLGT